MFGTSYYVRPFLTNFYTENSVRKLEESRAVRGLTLNTKWSNSRRYAISESSMISVQLERNAAAFEMKCSMKIPKSYCDVCLKCLENTASCLRSVCRVDLQKTSRCVAELEAVSRNPTQVLSIPSDLTISIGITCIASHRGEFVRLRDVRSVSFKIPFWQGS